MSVEDVNSLVTSTAIHAAEKSILWASGRLAKCPKCWWTDCVKTKKEQNCAWGTFRRYPHHETSWHSKKACAKTRWMRHQAEWFSWCKFVSSLTDNAPSKAVWDRVKKIKGKCRSFSVPLLETNDILCQRLDQQVDFLGQRFCSISSCSRYSNKFLSVKQCVETQIISTTGGEN